MSEFEIEKFMKGTPTYSKESWTQVALLLCEEAQQSIFTNGRCISMNLGCGFADTLDTCTKPPAKSTHIPRCTNCLDRGRSAHTCTGFLSKAVQAFLHSTGVRVPHSEETPPFLQNAPPLLRKRGGTTHLRKPPLS